MNTLCMIDEQYLPEAIKRVNIMNNGADLINRRYIKANNDIGTGEYDETI